jgi:hypothetical protein
MLHAKKLLLKKPKRLSKAGEFMKKYPKGFITILDMKAAVK